MDISKKKEYSQFSDHKLYSFILDPFLLIGMGIFIIYLSRKFLYKKFPRSKKYAAPILAVLTLFIFWIVAGALYFDFLNLPVFGDYGKGNHFMWNSGVELLGLKPFVDSTPPTYANFKSSINILGLGIFLTYPFFLYLGIRIGRRFFKLSG